MFEKNLMMTILVPPEYNQRHFSWHSISVFIVRISRADTDRCLVMNAGNDTERSKTTAIWDVWHQDSWRMRLLINKGHDTPSR